MIDKNNNFDFLRFLFAVFVVVSHSFDLSGSNESLTWINKVTNGQIVFSQVGLSGFFVISGYFIFKSLNRSKNLFDYFKKRFLRIFPALAMVLLLSLIVSYFLYQGTIPFFKNIEVYSYFFHNITLYKFQAGIDGVFKENPYHSINGSLWTIRYEFCLYILISFFYFFKNRKHFAVFWLSLAFVVLAVAYNFLMDNFGGSILFDFRGAFVFNLGTFFVCGSLLSALNFEKILKKWFLPLAVFILLVAIHFNVYDLVKHVVLPIIILSIGFTPLPFFSTFGKIGDMSYGIYIYSFPIQQSLVYLYQFDAHQLMFSSLLLSISFGCLSWHLVEKRALRYKSKPVHIFKSRFAITK